jgi:hypothetical protein
MLKVLHNIITAIDKRQYCAAVFIDLAKAFDSVNHRILILMRVPQGSILGLTLFSVYTVEVGSLHTLRMGVI